MINPLKDRKKSKVLNSSKRTLITATNPKSPIAEQYRAIRTSMQFSMIDKELRTLLCTSGSPSEGKSTTTSNLAVTLAQQGQKVLLVDADLRKPTIHQVLQVSNKRGLSSLITKKVAIKDAVVTKTNVNGLHVLTSGPIPPNPSEMLGSSAMGELIDELLELYDIVLFDTPPILAVADALVLANYCDGAILVLRSHQTEKKNLVKAKELLHRSNVNVLGAVLNGVDSKHADYSNYYGVAASAYGIGVDK